MADKPSGSVQPHGLHSSFFHGVLRQWQTSDTVISPANIVFPIIITDVEDAEEETPSMPEQYRYGVNRVVEALKPVVENGLHAVLLFGVSTKLPKDERGSSADTENAPVVEAIRRLREAYPKLLIICDVCVCAYTSHGHCGIVHSDGTINNDASNERLVEVALAYARAGCHVVAPSAMMDGRVGAIKKALYSAGFGSRVSVLSYVKFGSGLFGPFRVAAKSDPAMDDKRWYQLPPGSAGLAIRTADQDMNEGADLLMVKPGMICLDIARQLKDKYPHYPLAMYQVAGEYAMFWHASKAGAIDLRAVLMETMICMRRAGADIIMTYFAPRILSWLAER